MIELLYPIGQAPVKPGLRSYLANVKTVSGREFLPIVDGNGVVLARADRDYIHSGEKCLHPVVHLHILDRDGRLYLQKRAVSKKLLPGFWDTAVGGHVSYGESISEALYREADEELGMHDFHPVFLDSYEFESATERELVCVFACIGNFTPVPDADEVECGKYWTYDEIRASMGRSVLTPNFESEFEMVADRLLSML